MVSEEKTEASVDLNQTTKPLPPASLETKIEWRKMTRKSSRKKKTSPRGTSGIGPTFYMLDTSNVLQNLLAR